MYANIMDNHFLLNAKRWTTKGSLCLLLVPQTVTRTSLQAGLRNAAWVMAVQSPKWPATSSRWSLRSTVEMQQCQKSSAPATDGPRNSYSFNLSKPQNSHLWHEVTSFHKLGDAFAFQAPQPQNSKGVTGLVQCLGCDACKHPNRLSVMNN